MARLVYQEDVVNESLDLLVQARNTFSSGTDGLSSAIGVVRGARGAEYISTESMAAGIQSANNYANDANSQVSKIQDRVATIKQYNDDYDNLPLLQKILSTVGVSGVQLLGGVFNAGETIVDGFATLIGLVGGIFSSDFKQGVADFVATEHVNNVMNDIYSSDFGKEMVIASSVTPDNTAGKVFKIGGTVLGMIASFYVSKAALGLQSMTALPATNSLKDLGIFALNLAKDPLTLLSAGLSTVAGTGSGTQANLIMNKNETGEYNFDDAALKGLGNGVKNGLITEGITVGLGTIFAAARNWWNARGTDTGTENTDLILRDPTKTNSDLSLDGSDKWGATEWNKWHDNAEAAFKKGDISDIEWQNLNNQWKTAMKQVHPDLNGNTGGGNGGNPTVDGPTGGGPSGGDGGTPVSGNPSGGESPKTFDELFSGKQTPSGSSTGAAKDIVYNELDNQIVQLKGTGLTNSQKTDLYNSIKDSINNGASVSPVQQAGLNQVAKELGLDPINSISKSAVGGNATPQTGSVNTGGQTNTDLISLDPTKTQSGLNLEGSDKWGATEWNNWHNNVDAAYKNGDITSSEWSNLNSQWRNAAPQTGSVNPAGQTNTDLLSLNKGPLNNDLVTSVAGADKGVSTGVNVENSLASALKEVKKSTGLTVDDILKGKLGGTPTNETPTGDGSVTPPSGNTPSGDSTKKTFEDLLGKNKGNGNTPSGSESGGGLNKGDGGNGGLGQKLQEKPGSSGPQVAVKEKSQIEIVVNETSNGLELQGVGEDGIPYKVEISPIKNPANPSAGNPVTPSTATPATPSTVGTPIEAGKGPLDSDWFRKALEAETGGAAGAQTSTTQTPAKTPEKTPTQTPAQTPEKTPTQTPVQAPEQTPVQAPAQTPEKAPEKAGVSTQTIEKPKTQTPEIVTQEPKTIVPAEKTPGTGKTPEQKTGVEKAPEKVQTPAKTQEKQVQEVQKGGTSGGVKTDTGTASETRVPVPAIDEPKTGASPEPDPSPKPAQKEVEKVKTGTGTEVIVRGDEEPEYQYQPEYQPAHDERVGTMTGTKTGLDTESGAGTGSGTGTGAPPISPTKGGDELVTTPPTTPQFRAPVPPNDDVPPGGGGDTPTGGGSTPTGGGGTPSGGSPTGGGGTPTGGGGTPSGGGSSGGGGNAGDPGTGGYGNPQPYEQPTYDQPTYEQPTYEQPSYDMQQPEQSGPESSGPHSLGSEVANRSVGGLGSTLPANEYVAIPKTGVGDGFNWKDYSAPITVGLTAGLIGLGASALHKKKKSDDDEEENDEDTEGTENTDDEYSYEARRDKPIQEFELVDPDYK